MNDPENPIQASLQILFEPIKRGDNLSVHALLVRNGDNITFAHAYKRNARELMANLGMGTIDAFLPLFREGIADARICTIRDKGGKFHHLFPGTLAEGEQAQIRLFSVAPEYNSDEPLWRVDSPSARRETGRILQEALPGCEVR